ncbi:tRNA (uridine(54)-C5)-methyltransferase TrmA [Neptunicella sp. SCSIO 80796]|uniref:tRNA (uridine(54)-C5)-methyltransferase TrmA n=1 Tax=Neptunicella plasticusilytica TaxID=3117012 RepID=UPI003A4DA177
MRPTQIDPADYAELLAAKASQIADSFAGLTPPKLEIFPSPTLYYRQRAEFRVWHAGDDLYHIMFDQQTKQKYRVDHYPPGSELINAVMTDLVALLKNNEIARKKLFQIDYLSCLSQQIVVTLLYHKPLCDEWMAAIQTILQVLRDKYDIHLIGRAKKQKVVLDQDFVVESLDINQRQYHFKQIENSFTQPNAAVNCSMIEWALDCTENASGDLLELYCGAGNFTLPLAQNFRRVLATEISKPSVAAAQFNIDINQIENVTILRMSSEEFTQAMNKVRSFTRLQDIDLDGFDCHTIFVDPPRAGLDQDTVKLVSQYQHILYISCNPETLKDNLDTLCQTHDIKRFAMFDQFPYTHHAECGVLLQKR